MDNLSLDTDDLDKSFCPGYRERHPCGRYSQGTKCRVVEALGIRVIFGFDKNIQESYLDMDKFIGYSAPYVGFKRGKMQYLYQSEESGPRFGAMDLIPDDPKTKSLLERMKEANSWAMKDCC